MGNSQDINVFALMPVEVFMDDRLTKTDLRVLGAILTYRDKVTNVCWPKRDQIAARCGLPLCKISTATSHLVQLGWLKKEGSGGHSSSTRYTFAMPDMCLGKVTDSVTVTKSVTVTNSVTPTVTDSVTSTVTDSVTPTVTDSVRGNITNHGTDQRTDQRTDQHTLTNPPVISEAVKACVLFTSLGMVQVNPSHPDLLSLVDADATMADFEFAGKTAVERGKGFGYALGIVRSCLQDRQLRKTNPIPNPGVHRERKIDSSFAEKYPHLC